MKKKCYKSLVFIIIVIMVLSFVSFVEAEESQPDKKIAFTAPSDGLYLVTGASWTYNEVSHIEAYYDENYSDLIAAVKNYAPNGDWAAAPTPRLYLNLKENQTVYLYGYGESHSAVFTMCVDKCIDISNAQVKIPRSVYTDGTWEIEDAFEVIVDGQRIPPSNYRVRAKYVDKKTGIMLDGDNAIIITGNWNAIGEVVTPVLREENVTQSRSNTFDFAKLKQGLTRIDMYTCNTSYLSSKVACQTAGNKEIPVTVNKRKKLINEVKISTDKSAFSYSGKAQRPKIVVRNFVNGSDYSIKYSNSNSKSVGTYSATIIGGNRIIGNKVFRYTINPKGTSIKKISKSKKSFTIKWKQQSAKMSKVRITGYQIQYSTNQNFSTGNKMITVKGYTKTYKKISKLKANKKYYIRIRTYMKTGNKTYYSGWSKTKSIKTK